MPDVAPWMDCPKCPGCGYQAGMPLAAHGSREQSSAAAGKRLICAACGHKWDGTVDEVLQAVDAQEAWDVREARSGRKMRREAHESTRLAEEKRKVEALMRGSWR